MLLRCSYTSKFHHLIEILSQLKFQQNPEGGGGGGESHMKGAGMFIRSFELNL